MSDEELMEMAKHISSVLLMAGRSRADTYIPGRGERGISFHEFVFRELKKVRTMSEERINLS